MVVQLLTNCIVLLCPMHTEPRAKRGRLGTQPLVKYWQHEHAEIRKKHQKKSKSYFTIWTHIWISAVRDVDLETSAKRGTNKTRALVSLYWSFWILHLKQSPNQISCKSTKVSSVKLHLTWKKSDQIPQSYALQHIKTIFPKTTKSTMTHDCSYKWGCHTKDKTKSKPLPIEKVTILLKFLLSF